MSNGQKSTDEQQDNDQFQLLSEQEQMSISGGGISAFKPNACKDYEYWDATLIRCIKKDTQSLAAM